MSMHTTYQEFEMQFDEYMEATRETAMYPTEIVDKDGKTHPMGLFYVALGLGEVGEVQNKVKKIIRDHGGQVSDEFRTDLIKEAGDTLWYLARLCDELNASFDEVAQMNLDKLRSRKTRGVLSGSGDNR